MPFSPASLVSVLLPIAGTIVKNILEDNSGSHDNAAPIIVNTTTSPDNNKELATVAADVGSVICEGVIKAINNTSANDILVTNGYDPNGKLSVAINNRPELHYHNTFNFYISGVDSTNTDEVESMIYRLAATIPSK